MANFILTLEIQDDVADILTKWRTRLFPPDRNFLSAHVTLFHALPLERRGDWQRDLESVATNPFIVRFDVPYSLGRGVAIRVVSPELEDLRRRLSRPWQEFLSAQDRRGYRPHCTLQNKVDPSTARATLSLLEREWQPLSARATGLKLWEYLGGPWRPDHEFTF